MTGPPLLLATKNPNKVAELKPLLAPVLEALGLDLRLLGPAGPTVVEDAPTLAGNAIRKAIAAARWSGETALGEDSGLEVEALDGAPGVLSARYSGGGADENNRLLLTNLAGVPKKRRAARFRAVVAVATAAGLLFVAEGATEGEIAESPRGSGGFGYDPIFRSRELGRTFAEVSAEEKSRVSHRSRAVRAVRGYLFEALASRDFPTIRGPVPGHGSSVRIMRETGCQSRLIAHQLATGRVCRELALSLAEAGVAVDVPLAAAAGLLHDVGKTGVVAATVDESLSPPAGVVRHGWLSAVWLDGQGFDPRLGRATLVHGLDSLVTTVFRPATWEERILALCDKLVERDYVGLVARLAGLERRHPAARELVLACEEPLRRLATDLAGAGWMTVDEMERRLAATLATRIIVAEAGSPDGTPEGRALTVPGPRSILG